MWTILIIEMILVMMFSLPNLFGVKPYVVSSGSMMPKYSVGSMIYVEKVDASSLNVGDSITFFMSDRKIVATHEIYKIDDTNKLFYTHGINNRDENGNILPDAKPVEFENLIGKPIICIPYLGFINKFITTSPGMYFIVILTIIIIFISYLLDKKQKE